MSEKLDFSLPDDPASNPRKAMSGGLLWVVLLLQIALLGFMAWRLGGVPAAAVKASGAVQLDVDGQRDLALKLEKQGLADEAAAAWRKYLVVKKADTVKSAEIWYRIGTVYQEAGQYEKALAAYYRSEAFAKVPHLADELSRRVQECLEAAGKYAALRYELAERTTVGGKASPGGEVVAEIGPTRITLADLDRKIEDLVDRQLDQFAGALTPEQRRQRREELLKRLSDNATRRRILRQFITEEILCREAREEKLAEDPEVAKRLEQAERSILAQSLMERQLQAGATITPGDVETFYKANKERFMEPERVTLAHILLPDKQRARDVIASLGEGQDFAKLARELSDDKTSAEKGGMLPADVPKGQDELPGFGRVEGLGKAVGSASAGTVLSDPLASKAGWHVVKVVARHPARQRTLDESRDEAYRLLRARKEQEIQEAFLQRLFEKYKVVLHAGTLGDTGSKTDPSPAPPTPPVAP